jgi:5'-nucleotidase
VVDERVGDGVAALAVSLHHTPDGPLTHFDAAAELAARVVARLVREGLPPRTCLNLNVPDLPLHQIRGIHVAAQGWRHYDAQVDARHDPRGKAYYWLGGAHSRFEDLPDTDGPLIERGWATLTPLRADLTHYDLLPELRRWADDA